ncbi:DNA mismatch endonuclease Vsr [Thalassomonas viridans]|uniref:DNA mismatch endonuclease Vsr n=1 Tax=Thalassomonas viridans TaxID=137584 RepID=A0AAF0C805_9GAMM|nr:DNA mismatch endonuclease Vsr [Thalassomonas viridans]WDE03705.1 DNA mismatch endonuclease Vsr [Thalassomonas viridans]
MIDVHSKKIRSKNMAAIRNKNTKPELLIRRLLHSLGLRFRLYNKSLPGTPDITLAKYKAVIFVNGCFWHGHEMNGVNCHFFTTPKTRTEFWLDKINGNKKRDQQVFSELSKDGWKVLYIWECALKGKRKLEEGRLIDTIEEWLLAHDTSAEIDCRGIKKKAIINFL